MPTITIHRRSPAPSEGADTRELVERIERLQRRIAAMTAAANTTDSELRRQRAAGRRP